MKHLVLYIVMPIVCVLAFINCSEPIDQLRCNIGVVDITPEESVVLAGFAAREGLSTGIHRPLKSRCMVIENDSVRVCIISNDMMEISIGTASDLRQEIAMQTGIPYNHIFIHCTHTHSAPRTGGNSVEEGGPNYAYAKKFRETVIKNAVETANNQKAFIAFTIETGKGTCDINCNRCEEDGPCDHDLHLAHFLDKERKSFVSLLNFACHPVSLNHSSLVVSPDFPGITMDELSKEWRNEVLYFSGAAGNVNPCGSLKADTFYTQARGMELADAARKIQTQKIKESSSIFISNIKTKLPFRVPAITPEIVNNHADEIKQWKPFETWKNDVERWRSATLEKIEKGEINSWLPFEIASVNIGGLVLFFSQGEPFNEYQTLLRENNPDTPIFFIAYTNGQNSYLPSKHAFESDAYEYEKEQMHIYIGAPYPLSDEMPAVYEMAMEQTVNDVISN